MVLFFVVSILICVLGVFGTKECKNNRKTSKMRKEGLLGMIGKSTATRYIKK